MMGNRLDKQKKTRGLSNESGFSLIELLISIAILGIIMVGLSQVMGTALSAYEQTTNKQELLAQARYAMDRMVMFAQETDVITMPDSATDQEILTVKERLLDTYNNATHAYVAAGDGYLDADNDSDGLLNEGGGDTDDPITFDLDKTDPNNWKLQEQMPDYSTGPLDDFLPVKVICEHVTSFTCNLLDTNLVEIQLTLNNGESEVSLKTRVVATNYAVPGGEPDDTTPPTPDPMTWSSQPAATGSTSIEMTATTTSDPSGVEYYFECTAGGGNNSGWQDSPTYEDTGLQPDTQYTYRVKARDKSVNQNETGWSSEDSATTQSVGSNEIYVNDITMGWRKQGSNYYGQATVWIKDSTSADVPDATVYGDWSGSVSGSDSGATGPDGKVMIESPAKKFGGTFTFTVTDVVKDGYTYNPALNVETSDSITAP